MWGRSALQSGKGLRDLNGLLFVQQEILFPVGQKVNARSLLCALAGKTWDLSAGKCLSCGRKISYNKFI